MFLCSDNMLPPGTSMATSWLGQFLQRLAICQNLATCEISPTTCLSVVFCFYLVYWARRFCRQLNDNKLVGQIPAELGKLEQLFELCVLLLYFMFFGHLQQYSVVNLLVIPCPRNLANNELEGPIPPNISSCTALNQLYDILLVMTYDIHFCHFFVILCTLNSYAIDICFCFLSPTLKQCAW